MFGNQGGGQGDTDIINVIDLKQNPPRIVDSISVGQTPEGVTMSPDGSYVAVTIQNGSQRPKTHQAYNDHGLVMVYRIDGTKLTLRRRGQGRRLGPGRGLEQGRQDPAVPGHARPRRCDVLSFDGKELKVTSSIKVNGGPAGLRTVER